MPSQRKLSSGVMDYALRKEATEKILKTLPGSYAVIEGLSVFSEVEADPYSFRFADGRLM